MTDQPKRLYRSQTNRVIAGICGGLAEYLNIDPTVVRILWVFLTLFGGSGILLYVIAYFIIPLNPAPGAVIPSTGGGVEAARVIGIALVVIGSIILLDNLDVFHFHRWMRHSWELIVPALLVAFGVYILVRPRPDTMPPPGNAPTSGGGGSTSSPGAGDIRRLQRSILDRKLFGVCGGLAAYFGIDSTIIRILFLVFALMSFGFGIVLYLILFLVMPEEQLVRS